MPERYKTSSIEDFVGSLVIPSEAISLNEMVGALIAEEEMLKLVKQPVNVAFQQARVAKRFTQKQLGKHIGVKSTTISHWETLRDFPDNKHAIKASQVLEVDRDQLFPPYLREFVGSREVSAGRQFETVHLDEVPENEIEQAMMINRRMVRTDFPEDPEEAAMKFLLREVVENALDSLPLRQRHITEMRFGLSYERRHTFRELGRYFNRTPDNMRQIVNKAIENLRQNKTLEETLREYYGVENKDAHKVTEALINGIVNAIHQKDFNRAQDNLAKIEKQEMALAGLDRQCIEREIVEELGCYPFSCRWSEETITRFIDWSNSRRGHFEIDIGNIMRVVTALREVWRLKAQIPVKTTV